MLTALRAFFWHSTPTMKQEKHACQCFHIPSCKRKPYPRCLWNFPLMFKENSPIYVPSWSIKGLFFFPFFGEGVLLWTEMRNVVYRVFPTLKVRIDVTTSTLVHPIGVMLSLGLRLMGLHHLYLSPFCLYYSLNQSGNFMNDQKSTS